LCDGIGDLRRPIPDADIEYPPVDSIDRVSGTWMPGQIIENFRRG
jgi:hypothetical protein